MEFIIDSYAWIEYVLGSKKGEILKKLFLNSTNQFFTVECCLAEIIGWSLRYKQDGVAIMKVIKTNSQLLSVNEMNWINAGKERFEQQKTQKDFGLIDAVIVIKQNELNCKVVTGDKHFKQMKNVVFLH